MIKLNLKLTIITKLKRYILAWAVIRHLKKKFCINIRWVANNINR